jgi:hypothetical protein
MKAIRPYTFLLLLLVSCVKDECRFPGAYEFVLPATLLPAEAVFHVGDTIRVTSIFADEVFERKTNRFYTLKDFRFHPITIVHRIDALPGREDGLRHFDLLIDSVYDYNVQLFSDAIELLGQYRYEDNTYDLRFELVARDTGLYYLQQGSVLLPMDRWQDFPGKKCKHTHSSARVALNGGADNNIEFLSHSPDPHYHDWMLQDPEGRFHKFGGYCFYVRE